MAAERRSRPPRGGYYSVDDDPVAARGRELMLEDRSTGGVPDGRGTAADRDVTLWFAKPPGLVAPA